MTKKLKDDSKNLQALPVTTDLWTSRNGDPFISLTVHYIDEQFTVNRYCLAIKSKAKQACFCYHSERYLT